MQTNTIKPLLFGIFSLLVLVVLNYAIWEKEVIKREGEPVFLELAPVDPRSLMQGDYMRLGFALRSEIKDSPPTEQRSGRIVVTLDDKRVAHFVRFYQGEDLQEPEKLLRYRWNFNNVSIVPDSFFFQEGHAEYYQPAKYGELRFKGADKYLLVGLRDEHFKLLEPPERDNRILDFVE